MIFRQTIQAKINMSIFSLENVEQSFDKLNVLNSLSLSLEKGQVLGLLGHNGAGKTTTMKLILGLLKPTSGKVRVFNRDPSEPSFSHHRYQIGFLPENVSFYQQLTGSEVLRFFGKLKKVDRARCDELLSQVGLTDAANRKVKTYSKGMKQRLGLAQAILTEPSLLLLDEPTVGLDPIATKEFYLIVDQLKALGCSIILCSHVLPGIEKHLDQVAILSKGQLAAFGSINELRAQTKLPTKVAFSGCFEIESLAKKLATAVHQDGENFYLMTNDEKKMTIISQLANQPGIKNIDTYPASLEQLYVHFMALDRLSHKTSSQPKRDLLNPPVDPKKIGEGL